MRYTKQAQIYEKHMNGMTFSEIGAEMGCSRSVASAAFSKEKKKRAMETASTPPIKKTTKISEGSCSFEGTIEGFTTAEDILKMKGLDPKLWKIKSFVTNTWEQQTKTGEKIELCQYKLTVVPAQEPRLSIEDIDLYFKEAMKRLDISYSIEPIDYESSDEILEIDIADLHCGLLSWANESGSDWNIEECSRQFLAGISDIVHRNDGRIFSRIYLCTLGDVLHCDNFNGTTTKGTQQDVDYRITKAIGTAFDTLQTAIEMLSNLNAPITYVYTCGNHDRVTGYCLAKMLEAANMSMKRDIIFDITPNPQKAIHFGKVLVGLTHGDMPSANKGSWLINDYRREFGESYFVEEHCGHIHHEEAKMHNGIMVRSVLAQCGNSYWEHQQGYRSYRGIQCFVWHPEKGLRETMYYNY